MRDRLDSSALVKNLRSLDAIHLATALSLGQDLAGIITYDQRLAEAALSADLEVWAPT